MTHEVLGRAQTFFSKSAHEIIPPLRGVRGGLLGFVIVLDNIPLAPLKGGIFERSIALPQRGKA